MWRRQERLTLRLGQPRSPLKHTTRLLGRSLLHLPKGTILNVPLGLLPSGISDESLGIAAEVKGEVYDSSCRAPVDQGLTSRGSFRAIVRSLSPLNAPRVRVPRLPQSGRVPVRAPTLKMASEVRTVSVGMSSTDVRMVECLKARSANTLDGGCFVLSGPEVHSADSRISRLPVTLASVDMNTLTEGERAGFIREAEALKQIPPERAELLAVFRHVPIEMISRLRFLADRRAVVYSISAAPKRTQTRVHDMAVVRDTGSQDVHFVPHRTQCRTASITSSSDGL